MSHYRHRSLWRALLTVVVITTVAGTGLASATTAVTSTTTTSSACQSAPAFDSLTVMQLASLVIVPTVSASNMSGASSISAAGYGGVMVAGNSAPPTFAQSVRTMQAASLEHVPVFVMTDAEGGGVMRLASALPKVPWAKTMGQWSASQLMAEGALLGRALRALGINMDLAPVADVDSRNQFPGAANPDGLRSFSGNPVVVGKAAAAFAAGLSSAKVLAVAKHFPGIGYSSGNSDYGVARSLPWPTIQLSSLVPFRALIAGNIPAVMMSNDITTGLTTVPASVSLTMYEYLRNTLHFNGLIITDSLSAGAISAAGLGLSAAAVRAVAAGANLVLLGSTTVAQALSNANAARATITIAVHEGTLSLATLHAAAWADWNARQRAFCTL